MSVQSSVESHARFADNRITTSGRAEDLGITATVWVGKRRGAATGNDAGADALKQLADEAVQIARVSPVHREYVPTLGPLTYAEDRGFAAATADIDLDGARDGARRRARRLPRGKGDRRRLPHAPAPRPPPSPPPTATAATSDRARRGFSITARSADGTGSGYFAGDHFDLARLDAQAHRRAGRGQGDALASSRSRSSPASTR